LKERKNECKWEKIVKYTKGMTQGKKRMIEKEQVGSTVTQEKEGKNKIKSPKWKGGKKRRDGEGRDLSIPPCY